MIDLLEKKGLLVRGKAKEDRRVFSISLTEDGTKYVEEIIPLAAEMRKFGLNSINNTDKALFIKILTKICGNLE
jgi:DNA-binding MarR family transcriptional regulator